MVKNKKDLMFILFVPEHKPQYTNPDLSPKGLQRLDAECRLDDFLSYDYTEGLQPLCWVESWLKRKYN
ncbi:hypothetical protein HZA97_05925 [Candidatus Woesearchaeota archaeon]|nr:hypothetical protein [Candidatus Woesearchaeota archaeon]